MITTIKEFKKIAEGFSSSHFTEIKDVIAKLGYKIDDIQPEDGSVGIFDGWVAFLDDEDNFYSVNYNDFNYELFETRDLPEEERLQRLQNFIDQRKEVIEESFNTTKAISEKAEGGIEISNIIEYDTYREFEEKLQDLYEVNTSIMLDDIQFDKVVSDKISEIHNARRIYDKKRLSEL